MEKFGLLLTGIVLKFRGISKMIMDVEIFSSGMTILGHMMIMYTGISLVMVAMLPALVRICIF